MLFTEKYAPKKLEDMVGNESIKDKIKKWMLDCKRKKNRRPLLIYGPSGIGKTAFAYALKEEFDLELIEMNASQFRNKKQVDNVIANTMLAGTLSGKGKMILIDDVDVLQKNDRGGASEISRLIKESNLPIILTAEDAWNRKISAIRMQCELIQLRRVTKRTIIKLLKHIAQKEDINIDEEIFNEISENSNGDVRAALNDLQSMHSVNRDGEKDIFNIMREIFKGQEYLTVRKLIDRNVDPNIVKLWVDENIPYEYSNHEDLAKAYYYMARADQFEGRIKQTRWTYLRYVIDFFTAGVALSKERKNNHFVKYKFPQYLKKMSTTIRKRALMKSIGLKLGKKIHTNRKEALEYLYIIANMLKNDGRRIQNYYRFEDAEIEFILNLPQEKVKIKHRKKTKKDKTREGMMNIYEFF